MANDNDKCRADDASKDTNDQTSSTKHSSMLNASLNASRPTPPDRLTVSSGIAPTHTEPSTTSEPTSRAPGANATTVAQPPGVDHSGSAVQVPYKHDKGTRVPFNFEVVQLFENGPPTGKVLFENHNGLISWLRHHGHRIGKHNQNDTVALVGNFLRHVHAFPDDFYGRLESPPDAVQRQLNASRRPVRRARKTSVRLESARTPIQSTATGEEVQHDTPDPPPMASPRRSDSSATQSAPNDTRERNIRGSEGASEANVPGSTTFPAGAPMYALGGNSSTSETPLIPNAASALVPGAHASGARLKDEGQKAKKSKEERQGAKGKAELYKDGDVDDPKSFKVTDPLNIVRPTCPNCCAVRCTENHSEQWCDCECWNCGRSGRK